MPHHSDVHKENYYYAAEINIKLKTNFQVIVQFEQFGNTRNFTGSRKIQAAWKQVQNYNESMMHHDNRYTNSTKRKILCFRKASLNFEEMTTLDHSHMFTIKQTNHSHSAPSSFLIGIRLLLYQKVWYLNMIQSVKLKTCCSSMVVPAKILTAFWKSWKMGLKSVHHDNTVTHTAFKDGDD